MRTRRGKVPSAFAFFARFRPALRATPDREGYGWKHTTGKGKRAERKSAVGVQALMRWNYCDEVESRAADKDYHWSDSNELTPIKRGLWSKNHMK